MINTGTLAERPPAGNAGDKFWCEDEDRFYTDDGEKWVTKDDEIDHWCTDKIVCPYCGHECDDTDFTPKGTFREWDCDKCNKTFKVEVDYDPTYYTTKMEAK